MNIKKNTFSKKYTKYFTPIFFKEEYKIKNKLNKKFKYQKTYFSLVVPHIVKNPEPSPT